MKSFKNVKRRFKKLIPVLPAVFSIGVASISMAESDTVKKDVAGGFSFKAKMMASEYTLQKAYPKGLHKLEAYPSEELQRGQEGWAVVSYIVDVNGKVKDPIVLDSVGSSSFSETAKKELLGIEFYPALLNGKPLETADNKYKFTFNAKKKTGECGGFVSQFRQVREHLLNNELDVFLRKIKILKDSKTHNHYENAFYWYLMAEYYFKIENSGSQLASLKRAVGYEGEYLPRNMLVSALSDLYYQQLAAGEIKGAFETAARIEAYLKRQPELKSVLHHRDQLIENLKIDPVITTSGAIGSSNFWGHDLLRRDVSLNVQSGDVETVEFRCEKQVSRFEYDKDGSKSTWTIPEEWGDCSIFVKGSADAKFVLLESL